MFPFEELSCIDVFSTFAYWVIVERKPLPEDAATLKALKGWMSYHYDIEEQAYSVAMLRTDEELLPEFVRLIAPVTLAEKWTPFALAAEILGPPVRAERGEGSRSSALGIWEPKFLGACKPESGSEHTRHFVFLLRLACSVALQDRGRVMIVGAPGWSYSNWKNDFRMINPETAVLMHEAGYLYTDRIAQ